jgi:hypothetical protein
VLIDKSSWGIATTNGVVAPTGRESDPDIIQDIAFGDGQWDLFSELAIGDIHNDRWSVGTTFRYTYQAPSDKTLRVPMDRDIRMSDTKGRFNVKFGDRIDYMLNTTYQFNDWLSLTPGYEFMYQMPSRYQSDFGVANDYLAYNSDRMAHNVRLTGALSTVQPYLKKKFVLPAIISMHVHHTAAGRNVPRMSRYEVEFRMYF